MEMERGITVRYRQAIPAARTLSIFLCRQSGVLSTNYWEEDFNQAKNSPERELIFYGGAQMEGLQVRMCAFAKLLFARRTSCFPRWPHVAAARLPRLSPLPGTLTRRRPRRARRNSHWPARQPMVTHGPTGSPAGIAESVVLAGLAGIRAPHAGRLTFWSRR
jgi:hypothetical protein